MDFLSHLFFPLTAAYVLWQRRFQSRWLVPIAGFGVLPDFDKFLGTPGLLHSLVTLVPICVIILSIEQYIEGELLISKAIIFFLGSHLVLDFVAGGPVPLFYPFLEGGPGLTYPARTAFGTGPVGLAVEGPLVTLRSASPQPGHNTYGFITGAGVASVLLYVVVFIGSKHNN